MRSRRLVSALLPFIVVGVFLTMFGIAYSSGMSMFPTIKDNTVLVTNRLKEPSYNDVVTIYSDELDKILLKRVIGFEGDEISIKNGVVYRNGEKLDESFNKDTSTNLNYVVEKNHVFVMGDNRNNSTDSRVLGAIPMNNIKGIVILNTGIQKNVFVPTALILMGVLLIYAYVQDKRDMKRLKNLS